MIVGDIADSCRTCLKHRIARATAGVVFEANATTGPNTGKDTDCSIWSTAIGESGLSDQRSSPPDPKLRTFSYAGRKHATRRVALQACWNCARMMDMVLDEAPPNLEVGAER